MNNPVSRRKALAMTGALMSLSGMVSSVVAAGNADGWKTAVGLNGFQSGTHKYKKNYPIWEVLEFAAQNKFDGVELVSDWPMGGYPQAREAARIKALRGLYDRYGLKIFSIQLGASGAFAPDAAERKSWLEEFRDRIALAKDLGCDCVGLWPGGGLRGQTLDQALDKLCDSFHAAADIAADKGVLACFEIEPPFVFNTEDHYQRILKGANHPNLKGIYDPSHFDMMSGATGKPEEMLKRVGAKNIGYLQFCDTDSTLRDGGTSKHLASGDGRTDGAAALRYLKENGFRGWIMIDEWEVPDPYDACIKGKQLVDKVWKES